MPSSDFTPEQLQSFTTKQLKNIFPTKAGTFRLKWREGKKQRSKVFKKLEKAVKFKEEIGQRKEEGKPVVLRREVPTLREFVVLWLATRVNLTAVTRANYVNLLETHVLPELGDLSLLDLRPQRLQEWQDARLAAGAGPYRLGRAQGLLGLVLKKAAGSYEYLDFNPVDLLDKPEYKKETHRWCSVAEVEALRRWYLSREDPAGAALVSCMGFMGPRPGAFLARSWADRRSTPPKWVMNPAPGSGAMLVNSRNSDGVILPGAKSDNELRSLVYVPAPVMEDLDLLEGMRGGDGLIWGRSDGKPWTKHDYDNWRSRDPKAPGQRRPRCFRLAAEETGAGDLSPYDLRHTAATLLAAAGWMADAIARQLQNSVGVCEKVYRHLLDEAPEGNPHSIDAMIYEARGERVVAGS